MTRGLVELPDGLQLTLSMGPRDACHSYYARIQRPDGVVRIIAGSAPTARGCWDAVLAAVEREAQVAT